jgi:hypothetical protein
MIKLDNSFDLNIKNLIIALIRLWSYFRHLFKILDICSIQTGCDILLS